MFLNFYYGRLLYQGCIGYWCYDINIQEHEEKVEDIFIVCEFRDVNGFNRIEITEDLVN